MTGQEVTEAEEPVCPTPAGLLSGLEVPSNYPQCNATPLHPGARADTQSCRPEAPPRLLPCTLGLGWFCCWPGACPACLPSGLLANTSYCLGPEKSINITGEFRSLNVTSSDISECFPSRSQQSRVPRAQRGKQATWRKLSCLHLVKCQG